MIEAIPNYAPTFPMKLTESPSSPDITGAQLEFFCSYVQFIKIWSETFQSVALNTGDDNLISVCLVVFHSWYAKWSFREI